MEQPKGINSSFLLQGALIELDKRRKMEYAAMEQPNQNKDKRKDRKQVQVIIVSLSVIMITTTFKTNRVMAILKVETDNYN